MFYNLSFFHLLSFEFITQLKPLTLYLEYILCLKN
jgi:hypothetical protein